MLHTYIHTYYIHTYVRIYIHTYPTPMCMYIRMYIHTYIHTYIPYTSVGGERAGATPSEPHEPRRNGLCCAHAHGVWYFGG